MEVFVEQRPKERERCLDETSEEHKRKCGDMCEKRGKRRLLEDQYYTAQTEGG